jgi:hypothetical protein
MEVVMSKKRFLRFLFCMVVIFQISCYFGKPEVVYFDGHMHTTHSDGSGSIADLKEVALARNLDAVFVTNHAKSIIDVDEWNDIVDSCGALSEEEFLMIPSFEITGSEGLLCRDHVLAWGVESPFVGDPVNGSVPEEVWPSPSNPYGTGPLYPENIREWTDWIHDNNGLAVHNHTTGTTQLSYNVDFIEVINMSHIKDFARFAEMAGFSEDDAWNLGLLFNSFSVYGDRYLQMIVDMPNPYNPGTTIQLPLQQALYLGTALIGDMGENSGGAQWLGYGLPENLIGSEAMPGAPLNSWDDLLMAYINGEIDHPVYCVANSDSHNTANIDVGSADYDDSDVGEAKNGVFLSHLDKRSLLCAISRGNLFATSGPSIYFDVNRKIMGETLKIGAKGKKPVSLTLSVDSESPTALLVTVDIIKNGEVIHSVQPMASEYQLVLKDEVSEDCYYRVEVTSLEGADNRPRFAYGNPVFIDFSGKKPCVRH